MPDWNQFEGEIIAGQFPLERHLGGAVFLTRFASGSAVIKLKPAGQAQAAELVSRWNRVAALRHPHLAGILATGTAVLAGVPLAYLVTEHAEEDLADVLRDRPLTTDEAREMLLPVAEALAYLHGQGLVHGDLKPSNILAIGETVKISSETVSAGSPAADIRVLGLTLVQALTQQADAVVEALPSPDREMAQHCLHHDPRHRWSANQIAAWCRSPERPAPIPPASHPRRRQHVPAVVVVVVAATIVGGLVMHRTAGPVPSAGEPKRSSPAPAPAGPPPTDQAAGSKATPPAPDRNSVSEPPNRTPPAPAGPAPTGSAQAPEVAPPAQADRLAEPSRTLAAQDGITRRVLPDIPAKARATVRGTARVVVRVTVDSAGKVTDATLEPGGSPYFGRLAVAAARQWQFDPTDSESPRSWILRFGITQTDTKAFARRAGRE